MEKMTYVNALENALSLLNANVGNGFDEFDVRATIEKLTALKATTEKRNSARGGNGKPTKKQTENNAVKIAIKEILTDHDPMKCGDIANLVSISGQKCSALLSQMVGAGEVHKETTKHGSLFSIPVEEDDVQALPGEITY